MKLSSLGILGILGIPRALLALALCCALEPVAAAQGVAEAGQSTQAMSSDLQARYPAGSIKSLAMVDQALADIAKDRLGIAARYAAEERACFGKFFFTECEELAKGRRREALARLRPIEVEANRFRRAAQVAERDRVLAEHLRQDALEAPQRALQEQEQVKKRAERLKVHEQNLKEDQQRAAAVQRDDKQRIAEHEAKLKRRQAEDAANAPKRAENAAAFAKKQRDVETHQRAHDAKKAEREAQAKEKEKKAAASKAQ